MIKAKNIRVEVGEIPKNKKEGIIYFQNFEEMNKILTPKRINLLNVVKEKKPESIYQLAKILNQDQGNVTKDVNILNKYGFLEVERKKEGERVKAKPKYEMEGIDMVIKIGSGTIGLAKEVVQNTFEELKTKNMEKNKNDLKKNAKKAAETVKGIVQDLTK